MKRIILILPILLLWVACSNSEEKTDAYGYFEVDRTLVSAEASGQIKSLQLEEGQWLKAGESVGQIDSMPLHFKRQQLEIQEDVLKSNFNSIEREMDVIQQQQANVMKDFKRVEKLLKKGAATPKQKDDVEGRLKVLEKQLEAVATKRQSLNNQIKQVQNQLDEINYGIGKTSLINPVEGIVMSKMARLGEMANPGRPLYSIGNAKKINLKAYITGEQLPNIKLGSKAQVITDDGNGGLKTWPAVVSWIAENAEFTPKTIHTRKERVNLVYAIKLQVENDGSLKAGMPGEVKF